VEPDAAGTFALAAAAGRNAGMRRASILIFLVGIAVITVLVVSRGAGAVWHALAAVGWSGFALLCLCHIGLFGLMGLSWRMIVPDTEGVPRGSFVWARLVRDAGGDLLPFSQLGGFVMGARAVALCGVPNLIAAASTVVDVTLELFAQLVFTAIGLGLLVITRPDSVLVLPVAAALGIGLAATIGFVIVQRRGLSILDRIAHHFLGVWSKTGLSLAGVQAAIADIYRRPGRAWLCTGLHLAAWIASGLEAWLALRLMGVSIDVGAVLAIESLLYAVRSVAFAVPNAVGVQEGAYLVIGGLFGLAPETVLALSLLKRARDLTLGAPALLAWQLVETRRVLAQRLARNKAHGSGLPEPTQAPNQT
jgi:glycosyltransferase 2 family protein